MTCHIADLVAPDRLALFAPWLDAIVILLGMAGWCAGRALPPWLGWNAAAGGYDA
ncbi:MAG: hypothetical protein KF858_03855 [Candidatus Sumerlaeia bacterium]|nr:hypothetical protein [Candidatus Sumerlaeia bacterium]